MWNTMVDGFKDYFAHTWHYIVVMLSNKILVYNSYS